jgi:hypothetical protein
MPWPCTRSSPRTPRCSTVFHAIGCNAGAIIFNGHVQALAAGIRAIPSATSASTRWFAHLKAFSSRLPSSSCRSPVAPEAYLGVDLEFAEDAALGIDLLQAAHDLSAKGSIGNGAANRFAVPTLRHATIGRPPGRPCGPAAP